MKTRMKKIWFSVVSLVLLIVVVFSVTMITASAETEVDYSFYNLSSAAASYMNKTFSPSNEGSTSLLLSGPSTSSSTGNAGTYIGYCDSERTGGLVYGWLMSALSSSSSTYSYASFKSDDTSHQKAFYYYTQYGNLLTQLGLDSTATEGGDFLRYISGGLMLLAYLLSMSVIGIFSIVFAVLKLLNPFNVFAAVPKVAQYLGYTSNPNSIFENAFSTVASWYNAITNLSWAIVVPLFFVFLMLSLMLLRTANKATKVKKYIIRIAFIAIGVPICAALYTGCLNSMSSSLANGSTTASTKIIASTFVDFEAWTVNSQLAPPSGGVFAMDNERNTRDGGGVVSNASYTNLRNTCMYINAKSNAISGFTTDNILGSSGDGSLTYDDTSSLSSYDVSTRGITDTINMVIRYMCNDFYHASDWESQCKNRIATNTSWEEWFKDMSKDDNWTNNPDSGKYLDNGVADRILFDGSLMYGSLSAHGATVYGYKATSSKGLSTLAMYNYLSTKFTSASVVVYSNEKSSSGFVRESHHSVNLIGGSGIMSFLYFLNAFTLLMAYAVVGWFYAISMCISNLKRGIKSIASIPFALLGSIPAIAKTITYVMMLIVEIIGTFFVYGLVIELIFSLNNMIEGLLTSAFNSISNIFATISVGDTPCVILASPIVMTLVMIAQCIFIIWFTITAIKLRKSIVRTMDEFVGNFIDRLFDTSNTAMPAPKEPGALSQGAGALATGAAMGAGQRLGNSVMSKNAQAASPQGTAKGSVNNTNVGGTSVDGAADITNIGNVGGTNDVIDESQGLSLLEAGNQSGSSMPQLQGGSEMMESGGGDPTGAAAGQVTGAMFAENNQEQEDKSVGERVEQMATLGGDTQSEKQEKQAIEDAQADRDMQAMMGQTSALEDEQYAEDKAQAEKEAKKEAATRAVKAGAQTVVGVGEAIGGAVSGNAGLVQDGAKNTLNGAGGLMDANKDARHAETNATAVAMQQEQQRNLAKDVNNNGVNNAYGEQANTVMASNVDNSSAENSDNISSQSTDTNNAVTNSANEQNLKAVQTDLNSNQVLSEGDINDASYRNSTQNSSNMTANSRDNVSNSQDLKTVQSSTDASTNHAVIGGNTANSSVSNVSGVSSMSNSHMANNQSLTGAQATGNNIMNAKSAYNMADNSSVSVAGGANNNSQHNNSRNSSVNSSFASANSSRANMSKNSLISTGVSNASVSNTNSVKKNITNNKPVKANIDSNKSKLPNKSAMPGSSVKTNSKSVSANTSKSSGQTTVSNKPVKNNNGSNQVLRTNNIQTKTGQKQQINKPATVRGEQARKTVAQQQRTTQVQQMPVRNNSSNTRFSKQSIQQGQTQHVNNVRQVNNSVQRQGVTRQNNNTYNNSQNVTVQRNLNTKVQQNTQRNNVQTQQRTYKVASGSRTLVSKGVSGTSDVDDII